MALGLRSGQLAGLDQLRRHPSRAARGHRPPGIGPDRGNPPGNHHSLAVHRAKPLGQVSQIG
jgi:hypothetical protein